MSLHGHSCKYRSIAGNEIRTDHIGFYCWSEWAARPGGSWRKGVNQADYRPSPGRWTTVGKVFQVESFLLSLARKFPPIWSQDWRSMGTGNKGGTTAFMPSTPVNVQLFVWGWFDLLMQCLDFQWLQELSSYEIYLSLNHAKKKCKILSGSRQRPSEPTLRDTEIINVSANVGKTQSLMSGTKWVWRIDFSFLCT